MAIAGVSEKMDNTTSAASAGTTSGGNHRNTTEIYKSQFKPSHSVAEPADDRGFGRSHRVGKTTTIAKLASILLVWRKSWANAIDTYRTAGNN